MGPMWKISDHVEATEPEYDPGNGHQELRHNASSTHQALNTLQPRLYTLLALKQSLPLFLLVTGNHHCIPSMTFLRNSLTPAQLHQTMSQQNPF